MNLDGKRTGIEWDPQHHAIGCKRCRLMMESRDVMVLTKDGWCCLDCVDRRDSCGLAVTAAELRDIMEGEANANG